MPPHGTPGPALSGAELGGLPGTLYTQLQVGRMLLRVTFPSLVFPTFFCRLRVVKTPQTSICGDIYAIGTTKENTACRLPVLIIV